MSQDLWENTIVSTAMEKGKILIAAQIGLLADTIRPCNVRACPGSYMYMAVHMCVT